MFNKIFFLIGWLLLAVPAQAHDVSLDVYKTSGTTQTSLDYQYAPDEDDDSANENDGASSYQFSLGVSSLTAEAYDGSGLAVTVTGRRFYAEAGYWTESDALYEVGVARNMETDVDVLTRTLNATYSQNYYFDEESALDKFKFKARLEIDDILHTAPSTVTVDTRILQTSLRVAGYFYFETFNLNIGYKKYRYSKDVTTFANDLYTVATNDQTSIFGDEVWAYPDAMFSAGGTYYINDMFSVDFDYSVSQPVVASEPSSTNYFVDLNADLANGFYLAVGLGQTTYVSTTSSASHVTVGASF